MVQSYTRNTKVKGQHRYTIAQLHTYILAYPKDKLGRREGTADALSVINPSHHLAGVLALGLPGALLFNCAPSTQWVGRGSAALAVSELGTLLEWNLEDLKGKNNIQKFCHSWVMIPYFVIF